MLQNQKASINLPNRDVALQEIKIEGMLEIGASQEHHSMKYIKKVRDFLYRGYLMDGEKILFVIHRHLLVEVKNFIRVIFFGFIIPYALYLFILPGRPFFLVWIGIGVLRFLYEFFDWYYDSWLVTNLGIVQVIWEGFFHKSSNRTEYQIIEGAGFEVKGFMRTLCNYGIITLEKYTGHAITFDGAISPRKKVERILAVQEKFLTERNLRDHRTLKGLLTDMLQHHVVEHGLPQSSEEE